MEVFRIAHMIETWQKLVLIIISLP